MKYMMFVVTSLEPDAEADESDVDLWVDPLDASGKRVIGEVLAPQSDSTVVKVRGGKVYGRWPGLAPEQRYEGRDLAVTTDFRSVFAEVTKAHMGLQSTQHVFPGFNAPAELGLIS